jgi:glycosyltransferase involved in cell wall biosynthesis
MTTSRKLRVLEMIDKPFLGGGQVHVLALAGALDKDIFDVSVAAGPGGPFEAESIRAGLPFISVTMGKRFNPKTARGIAAVLRDRRIDILHTHGGIAGVFGRWAAARAATPVVVHTIHGIHYLHYRNPLLRAVFIRQERFFARRSDAIILVSEADAAAARRHRLVPGDKLRVIRNGIAPFNPPEEDADSATPSEMRKAVGSAGPVVASVARLHRQKGIVHLLRAAPAVLSRFPEAKLAVAGGGPLERDLRREADGLGLGGRFLLLGERADAADLTALADVFVLPSLWEGLPLVLLEAAAAGKPIVASDIGGVQEVVRDGETAVLVPPGDSRRLAGAILRLLEDRDFARRLGERARAEIPPRFTLSGMTGAVQSLYLELSARKGVS